MTSSITLSALIRPSRMCCAAWAFCEPELRAAGDDLDLVGDVALQRLHEVERARDAVDEGHRVDGEVRLQLGQLEQVVEHHVGVGVRLSVMTSAVLPPAESRR